MSLTEGNHALEFLLSDNSGSRAYDQGVLLSGQDLVAGAVLGQITKTLSAAPIPSIVGTGTGAMTALTFGPAVQTGNYVITLLATSATAAFSVVAPDGTVLPNGAVGTAYTSNHLNFLVSSAGTMTVGDSYTVVVTAGGTPAVIGGTGTGTISAIALGPDAMNGGYQVICRAAVTNGGDFEVIAPDGGSVGRFIMGTGSGASATFTSRQITFTLTDSTDFIVGNYFNVIVAAGSGKYVAYTPGTFDGRHVAAGVLCYAADATAGDVNVTVLSRSEEVSSDRLTWAAAVTTSQKAFAATQLAARGIIVR